LASAPGQAPSPNVERALGSIRTMVLVALIFAIIIAILELVLLGDLIFLGVAVSELGAGQSVSAELGLVSLLVLVYLVINILVVTPHLEYAVGGKQWRHRCPEVVQLAWLGHSGPDIREHRIWRAASHSPRGHRQPTQPSGLTPSGQRFCTRRQKRKSSLAP